MNPEAEPVQRQTAEVRWSEQLAALSELPGPRPPGWRLSPRAVRSFLCGHPDGALPVGDTGRSVQIDRKFFGDDALVERAIVTLASERGLMLVGEPGTAKSLLSELLAAAISGVSTLLVQGTASTTEEQVRYGWNYALLLAEGPTPRALVPGPVLLGMRQGQLVRFEEITRCPPEIQDALVSVLSEKVLMVGELTDADRLVHARPGFNVIGTANLRDRGVHEMSAALKRRFNFETVQPLADHRLEVELVTREAGRQLAASGVTMSLPPDVVGLLVTTFQDLRSGVTAEGMKVERPSTVVSTAEAISVCVSAGLHAHYYGDGALRPVWIGRHLAGVVFKDRAEDLDHLRSYFRTVVRKRAEGEQDAALWQDLLGARPR
jgi:MoxR-like ATPase